MHVVAPDVTGSRMRTRSAAVAPAASTSSSVKGSPAIGGEAVTTPVGPRTVKVPAWSLNLSAQPF